MTPRIKGCLIYAWGGDIFQNHSCKISANKINIPFNLRLAQFYKDVELAEVMTDQDSRVGNILLEYEVEGENCEKSSSGECVYKKSF